jgi:hypothetical protein
MSTCKWLDLQALGSQLIIPKNLPDHWVEHVKYVFFGFCMQKV